MYIPNPTARLGEEIAAKFLVKRGYKIIDRNFRKGYGEIDIIAVNNKILVFVEVKTRTSNFFGTPFEQITSFKIRALERTALFYKKLHPNLPDAMRIDAIGIELDYSGDVSKIEHMENISGY
ncbi:MAG: YraN family protein [Candidatus Levybacteria bacterium CG10_big_fil_rev_8_21_14_0_10_35_13]|nr:MAG: YraN family protein [Candidatus Levybacteria bacterium CG10_big_fil_rev_8_21_14_0_10_35_13]